jgi:RNA polymerase sigma factor (TIGR02999 family)
MAEITELLKAAAEGREGSEAELFRAVYAELRKLAASYMRRERMDHTLQPTALVNEAYVRLFGGEKVSWECREHFFVTAAQTMRRVLIDHARKHSTAKRAGGLRRVDLSEGEIAVEAQAGELLALDAALNQLAALSPRQVRVVELKFFGGLGVPEIAKTLNISDKTVKRDWALARAWLETALRSK